MLLRAYDDDHQNTEALAQRFNRGSSWVRVTLFRARQALAACLQTNGKPNFIGLADFWILH